MEGKQDKTQEQKNFKFLDWKFILLIIIFAASKQFFTYRQEQAKKDLVNFEKITETIQSQIDDKSFSKFEEARQVLINNMSSEEKEYYFNFSTKIDNNKVDKKDLENFGIFLNSVMQRLPEEKKIVVLKVLQQGREIFGKSIEEDVLK